MNPGGQPPAISTHLRADRSDSKQTGTRTAFRDGGICRAIAERLCAFAALFALLWIPLSVGAFGQSEAAPATSAVAPVIPQQMRFTGTAPNRAGDTVEAVFRIYAAPEGGEPLWSETQRVTVDANGKYSVLLGSATQAGLPQTLFAGGQARWLGVSIERAEKLPRSPLTSVAYAMKAGDAQTVGGIPAGRFVTQEQFAAMSRAVAAQAILPNATPSGSGSTNYVPVWTSSSNLGDSVMYQSGSKIGIGTVNPASALHVYSGDLTIGSAGLSFPTTPGGSSSINQLSGGFLARMTLADGSGRLNLYWNAYSDLATGANKYYSSSEPATKWNVGGLGGAGGTALYVAPSGAAGGVINWKTVFSSDVNANVSLANNAMNLQSGGNVGIGTSTPAAKLEVNGTGKFDGLVTFAAGQTFPGTGPGTITGITTSSPLTGSGTSGSVALGLNTSALETTLSGIYAQLGAVNTFTQGQVFKGPISASQSAGPGNAAVTGTGTNGSVGVFGSSDSGYGIEGTSTSNNAGYFSNASAPNSTIYAFNFANTDGTFLPVAVHGSATGTSSVGVYGFGTLFGLWGNTTTAGSSAVYGTASDGYAGYFQNNGTGYPAAWFNNRAAGSATVAPISIQTSASGENALGVSSIVTGNGAYGLYGESDGGPASDSGRNAIGVKGVGLGNGGYGVVGEETGTMGVGVYGRASGAPVALLVPTGVYGLADTGTGVLGVAFGNSGVYNFYRNPLQFGPSAAGVWGDTSETSYNNATFKVVAGIVGTADDNGAGYFENNSALFPTVDAFNDNTGVVGTLFKVFEASTSKGVCGIGDGDLGCTGQLKAFATTGGGAHTVETYSVQSSENWMEDAGSGQLERGVAVVRIDPAFAETISGDSSYHVFLTPNGDSKGLYVINKTPTTFEVRESGGGTSSLSFDYRIMAKRRGYEAQRLVDVTERFNAEQAAVKRRLTAGVTARSSRGVVKTDLPPVLNPHAASQRAALANRNLRPGGGLPPGPARPPAMPANEVQKPVIKTGQEK